MQKGFTHTAPALPSDLLPHSHELHTFVAAVNAGSGLHEGADLG